MRFNPPKKVTFWITVILAVVGLVASFVSIPVLSGIAFWLVVAAYAILAISLLVKGM
jgi:hypothetical protein